MPFSLPKYLQDPGKRQGVFARLHRRAAPCWDSSNRTSREARRVGRRQHDGFYIIRSHHKQPARREPLDEVEDQIEGAIEQVAPPRPRPTRRRSLAQARSAGLDKPPMPGADRDQHHIREAAPTARPALAVRRSS